MCQAKPLPRCSSHAPGLVQAAEYKYKIAKSATDKQRAKVEALVDVARNKGFSKEDIDSCSDASLNKLKAAKEKLRQCVDDSNEKLRDIWEAELHSDATKIGFKELTSNASLQNRDQRTDNAIALRTWHKRLRAVKGKDGKSIFDKNGDAWMRNAVLEEEYTVAARKYKEQSFQYNSVTDELKKMKFQFEELNQKPGKNSEDMKEMERLRQSAVSIREQHAKIHYAMILERTKMNLIDTSVSTEFKSTLELLVK